ncbi:LPXTG-motif cell wall anchor domain protein [Erysipelotrichaceae bacterium 3_1_53]|nr:LPXTG-motif cell wall anchor domain protein [Erysipelotrichaceae bacterium 3_1_53]
MKDGYAQAEITHFSVYAIVTYKDQFSDQPGTERPDPIPGDKPQNQDMQTPSDAGQAENPEVSQNGNGDKMENVNTGDNSNTAGLAALCLLSITGVILLRRRRKAD